MTDWLIVGAGYAGSVLAERIASQRGESVLVIDRRSHIGGNAYDEPDEHGILVHRYGPHIFHTNAARIFTYLSQFTLWRPYEHRVRAVVDGKLVPVPINIDTINMIFGLELTEDTVLGWLAEQQVQIDEIRTSEDVVLSAVGRELYEKIFRGYTRKQWGLDPSELDRSVTARIPTRTNRDDRYFTDTFQGLPLMGYTAMFRRMLDHPNIEVRLSTDWFDLRHDVPAPRVIFTGPIDAYFDHRYGKLPYRSLRFRFETLDMEQFQPVAQVNYPQTEDYTRITEFKLLTGERNSKTTIAYEYPTADGDPYYPIPRAENAELYRRYAELARAEENVWFVGRLASYRYYNMDQVVGQALATFDEIQERVPLERGRRIA
jgi:UDP-galactopyranose mutase